MKRITASWSILAALALLPGTAIAEETTTDEQNAAQQCKAQRTGMGTAAFNQLYGTNKNDKNAFGKCVSKHAREEQQERKAAKDNAAKQCKAERDADAAAFAEKYGTNKSKTNAYGKCVSTKAKENKQAEDEADEQKDEQTVNAARACRAEQKADPAAFAQTYGTNANKRNAFGKCVSKKSREQEGS